MGRLLGSHDSEGFDRPDLNKCPDCGCFFAQNNCPICGKECPEDMRAGNRKAVKVKKQRKGGSSRVTFVEWYHSLWFIALMMIFFPIVGIILLATSPHKRSAKIIFIIIAVVYAIISSIGIGNIIGTIEGMLDKPVNTSLSQEEYIAVCENTDAEDFYRQANNYKDKYISLRLTVNKKLLGGTDYYGGEDYETYYVCSSADGGDFEILIRDCLIDGRQNLISGDIVTVYGEGDGTPVIYDTEFNRYSLPCINVAYMGMIE